MNQIARERINRKQPFSTLNSLISHLFQPSIDHVASLISQAINVINMMVRTKKDVAYGGEFSAFTYCVK
ncbi:MAG: hypothetical protein ACK5T6_14540, partial [Pirellula sp.]